MTVVSFVLTTHNRPDDATDCINSVLDQEYKDVEIVVVTSPVGDATGQLRETFDDERVRIIEERARRGPAAAGNLAFEKATGDVIVSVDDDVVVDNPLATDRILDEFEANPDLGILAFKIVDFETGTVHLHEIPVGPNGHEPHVRHPTTYFVGAGAAFRAEAVANTEGYPVEFSYYMQELDLSFQVMKAGYDAVYEPDIVVRHRRSAPGRPDEHRRWQLSLENRIRVAIRHLPLRYVLSSCLVWTLYVLYRTQGSIRTVSRAYVNLLSDISELRSQRDVIDRTTLRRLAREGGRLWF